MLAVMSGAKLPPRALMAMPETGIVRDFADDVADSINKCFAGTGVQISAALAAEALRIRKALENPQLPQMIGVANRELMLKELGVAVSAGYTRLEQNLTRFVLATIQLKDQAAGDEEIAYLSSLKTLGGQIPWDQLGTGGAMLLVSEAALSEVVTSFRAT